MRFLTPLIRNLLASALLLLSPALAETKDETRAKAEQGDAKAQYNLGLYYDNGLGLEEDDAEAVKWYRKATEQGNACKK